MPLTEDNRVLIEDVIMDLHYTASKVLDTSKDVHGKLLEISVQEAYDLLDNLKDELKDDDKIYDYKMHMLLPVQICELLKIRQNKPKEDEK